MHVEYVLYRALVIYIILYIDYGLHVDKETKEEKNLHCLFVTIASKLESKSRDNMIALLQEELQTHESVGTKLLLLLERAHQEGMILPGNLTQLNEWLKIIERDDLIKSCIGQFDPNKQFPGKYN